MDQNIFPNRAGILQGIASWKQPATSNEITLLLPQLFESFNALYLALIALPDPIGPQKPDFSKVSNQSLSGGTNSYYFSIPLAPKEYLNFRIVLELLGGDIYNILFILGNENGNFDFADLSEPLNKIWQKVQPFRPARNFFAHFEDRMKKKEKGINFYGVSGPLDLSADIGWKYNENSKGIIHFLLFENTLYFVDRPRSGKTPATHCKVDFARDQFISIFSAAREIYSKLPLSNTFPGLHQNPASFYVKFS